MAPARPAPPPARLFVALWPDAPTVAALRAAGAALRWPAGARVAPPERWHVTLHFIGAVPAARVGDIAAGLVLPPRAPFELRFDRLTAWPRGLAVLEPDAVPSGLVQLHADLAAALRALALPVEGRALRVHVTLAREAAAAELAPWSGPLHWPCDGYALMQSDAGYRVLRRYPFAPRRGRDSYH